MKNEPPEAGSLGPWHSGGSFFERSRRGLDLESDWGSVLGDGPRMG